LKGVAVRIITFFKGMYSLDVKPETGIPDTVMCKKFSIALIE
jgi:hypothetical protein